jgi:hypothetical protein
VSPRHIEELGKHVVAHAVDRVCAQRRAATFVALATESLDKLYHKWVIPIVEHASADRRKHHGELFVLGRYVLSHEPLRLLAQPACELAILVCGTLRQLRRLVSLFHLGILSSRFGLSGPPTTPCSAPASMPHLAVCQGYVALAPSRYPAPTPIRFCALCQSCHVESRRPFGRASISSLSSRPCKGFVAKSSERAQSVQGRPFALLTTMASAPSASARQLTVECQRFHRGSNRIILSCVFECTLALCLFVVLMLTLVLRVQRCLVSPVNQGELTRPRGRGRIDGQLVLLL